MAKIRLSFDDGPTPLAALDMIVGVLGTHLIVADFYMNGSRITRGAAEIAVLKVHKLGHRVENHTWTHEILTPMPLDQVRREVGDTQDLIKKITGRAPTRLRPPYGGGAFTRPRDPELVQVAQEYGLAITLWDVDSRDWENPKGLARSMDKIVKDVAQMAHRPLVDILMHVRNDTARDLDGLIRRLKKEGHSFG